MLYNLLKDIRRQLGAKTPLTAEEQCLLERIDHAVPHIRRDGDAEWLQPGEVLVRVCPDTGRPVLVCHDGEGQCTCLHNETVAEDAADVRLWLSSPGREGLQCRGGQTLGRKGFPCRGVGNYSMGRGIRNDTCWYGLGRRRLPPCHR